ncbi:MAG: DEAD/DEAH box helicase family protein [Chloroflexi bacterium]|nr:DEAD/DEAH box helicase family protein [Chloroflexota bacterium]
MDWDAHIKDEEAPLIAVPRKRLRPHQRDALHDVYARFAEHDRGKLIMACGTGKTFNSLRGAEEIARTGSADSSPPLVG